MPLTQKELKRKYPRWHNRKRRARQKHIRKMATGRKRRKRRPGLLEMLHRELRRKIPPRGYKRIKFSPYRPDGPQAEDPARRDVFAVDI